MPAYYAKPQSLDEIIDQAVGRSLDLFGLLHEDKYYRAFNILNYEV